LQELDEALLSPLEFFLVFTLLHFLVHFDVVENDTRTIGFFPREGTSGWPGNSGWVRPSM